MEENDPTAPFQHLLGKIVIDEKKFLAGRVKKIHPPGSFISQYNQKPVLAPVLEMDTGESFVAKAEELERWRVIEGVDEQFYVDVQTAVGGLAAAMIGGARNLNMSRKTAFLIVGRLMQVQGGIVLKPDPNEPSGDGWNDG